MQTGVTDDRSCYRTWQKHQSGVTREGVIAKRGVRVDQETVRVLCIMGYVVVGLLALWTALTFVAIAVGIRELLPGTLLKHLDLEAGLPRGDSLRTDICHFFIIALTVLLTVFWICWHYSGDAGDMPHHLLRVTAFVVGSWVVFVGVGIAYIVTLWVVVWLRWTKVFVAQHEERQDREGV
jgi:hypothetical protein